MKKRVLIQMTAQLYDVRTRKDGGGRIQLDFGADSIEAVMAIQRLNSIGDTSFAIALVPIHQNESFDVGIFSEGKTSDTEPDPEQSTESPDTEE